MKEKKVVQGSYISLKAKEAFIKESLKKEMFVSALTSEILEEAAQKIIRKEKKDEINPAN